MPTFLGMLIKIIEHLVIYFYIYTLFSNTLFFSLSMNTIQSL